MPAVYLPISVSKKVWIASLVHTLPILIFFKPARSF